MIKLHKALGATQWSDHHRYNCISSGSPLNNISVRGLFRRAPVVEQCSVASHKGDGQPLDEPACSGGLLLSSVPSKSTTQSLDLNNGTGVPGTKALHCQGEKDNALSVAGFPRFVKLSLMLKVESPCNMNHDS